MHGHLGTAAELARQRPIGSATIGHDATKQSRTRRRLDELVELGITVEREQANTLVVRVLDVDALLHRVAIGDPRRIGAGRETHVDLGRARDVEVGTQRDEELEDLRRWIGLDRIEDVGARQCVGQLAVAIGDDVEVDDDERCGKRVLGEEVVET